MIDPAYPILFYDGLCVLCSSTVQFILRVESSDHIRFATLQSEVGQKIKTKMHMADQTYDSIIFYEKGRYYQKSDAVIQISHHLKMPWRMANAFKVVPRGLRDAVYDLIARYRYQVLGKKEHCDLPTSANRHRFISL